jgi:hypothetical protein
MVNALGNPEYDATGPSRPIESIPTKEHVSAGVIAAGSRGKKKP